MSLRLLGTDLAAKLRGLGPGLKNALGVVLGKLLRRLPLPFLARPLCRNVLGILLYQFWRNLSRIFLEDLSGHFPPTKMRRNNLATKSVNQGSKGATFRFFEEAGRGLCKALCHVQPSSHRQPNREHVTSKQHFTALSEREANKGH